MEKFQKFPFAMVHASNVEPDAFWAERARRQKNGPEQNSRRHEKELQKRKKPAAES